MDMVRKLLIEVSAAATPLSHGPLTQLTVPLVSERQGVMLTMSYHQSSLPLKPKDVHSKAKPPLPPAVHLLAGA